MSNPAGARIAGSSDGRLSRERDMNLIPFIVIWSVMALAVLGLALYRKLMTLHGDDELIHLTEGEAKMIPQQVALANKLDAVDRRGKSLTALIVVTGLLIAAVYLYAAWERSFQLQ